MKIKLLFLFLLLAVTSKGQNASADSVTQYFVALYTTGKNWDASKQFFEQTYFNEHSSHLSSLRKAGNIATGGRYSDTGMIIIKASNEIEAQRLINEDPAIRNELFRVSVFPFDPFYSGCIE
jgi:uncharacterized protein YciI